MSSFASDLLERRLIIACDGTGQSSSRGAPEFATNVVRLIRALAADCREEQIVYYISGVGTGEVAQGLEALTGGTGLGLDDNVVDGYMYLVNNYRPGRDKLFFFGYSRGAFTARILAGIVAQLGILKPEQSYKIKLAYKAYKKGKAAFKEFVDKLHAQGKEGERPVHWPVGIEVVGCWDTVGAMGLPEWWVVRKLGLDRTFQFYDPSIKPGMKNVFHALSLDEHRLPFTPTLFYIPKELEGKVNLEQVWFAGAHCNIGGGGLANNTLSDITLAWMLGRCSSLLSFDLKHVSHAFGIAIDPSDPRRSSILPSSSQYKDWVDAITSDGKRLPPSYGCGPIDPSFWEHGMWLGGVRWRKPGRYGSGEKIMGPTNESVHPSVRMRREIMDSRVAAKVKGEERYRPESLKDFEPGKDGKGLPIWLRAGRMGKCVPNRTEVIIPEWLIEDGEKGFLERLILEEDMKVGKGGKRNKGGDAQMADADCVQSHDGVCMIEVKPVEGHGGLKSLRP